MATTAQTQLFATSIDLPQHTRVQMIELLNSCLAGILDLQMNAKYAHWNVKGAQFQQMHALFDDIAQHLQENADSTAERIAALGGVARGTVQQTAEASGLPPYDLDAVTGDQHVQALANRLASLASRMRAGAEAAHQIGDDASADLLIGAVRSMDKDLWLLDAHLFKEVT
jgi:starvation-inducible DNA-binding protein